MTLKSNQKQKRSRSFCCLFLSLAAAAINGESAMLVSLCAFTRLVSDFKPPLKRSWRACLFVLAAIYFSAENNNGGASAYTMCAEGRERDKSRPRFVLRNGFAYFADVREIARRKSLLNWWRINYLGLFRLSLRGECVKVLCYQLPSICQIWEREFNYLAPADLFQRQEVTESGPNWALNFNYHHVFPEIYEPIASKSEQKNLFPIIMDA